MDTASLAQAMGNVPGVNYAVLTPACNEAMLAAGCTTINRAAMWCAQIGHESVGLKYMREIWGPTVAQRGYEGRLSLGNTSPGDGKRYMGRGPIQLTGKHNYGVFSGWAAGRRLVGSPQEFVTNPLLVEVPRWGFLAASWYWTAARPLLNAYSDQGDLNAATRAINGGTNGWADRQTRWNRCRLMGARLLPAEGEDGIDLLPDERAALFAIRDALVKPVRPWLGGLSDRRPTVAEDPATAPYSALQYAMRDNVEIQQLRRVVDSLSTKLDALGGK